MTEHTDAKRHATDIGMKALYFLTIFMVIVGLVNATPGFPGYDALVSNIVGIGGLRFANSPMNGLSPIFALMMLIVSLKHSIWRTWSDKSLWQRRFGLFMDIALVTMAFVISGTYLIENEAICLIDR